MSVLVPKPLTKEAFAAFGYVIEQAGHTPKTINQGYALRFDDLAHIDVTSEGGSAKTSIFVAKPRPKPIAITMMEKHPLGSQLFYPLQDQPWLVVICESPEDLSSFHAFIASGTQGVNYHRNTWHFPLIVHEASRFIVVDRKGPGSNLVEVTLPTTLHIA